MSKWKDRMGRSKGNLRHRVPARVGNPPSKTANPEWWTIPENLMRLDKSYKDRRKYEQKKRQQSP
tara:strand:+ start:623 stop:817 length:195 start_codon:yes stop_codon:yes gene_type:complete